MTIDPARAKFLFLAAADLASPPDRAAYLDRECGQEPELRARVEALLAADLGAAQLPDPGTALEPDLRATKDGPPSDSADGDASLQAAASHSESREAADLQSNRKSGPYAAAKFIPGQFIAGRYTLLEVLGEGGMGTVYRADQAKPVRQVALKLIRIGMDSRAVLARFDAERQALALMDHPNIARVYDGGATETGQPFFAMELVEGVPFTEYCDKHRLSVRSRLGLFVQVCQAVQHAHHKGVIHRDLKPSNVLVTEIDGRPTPKVIDFGVAKATAFDLTDRSVSDTGAIVGTPTYMSPEQANPSSMDIDTRTDIYALGVILYELLAGSPPLDASQFKRGAILEMLRMVRQVDPPRPSTRVSTANALPSIAATRDIDPAHLKRALQGDLDWIVMKALEKDRDRRYDTANGLADDVMRHLDNEPVRAAPPSHVYRARKFIRKHRTGVLAASLVVLALLGGIAGMTWGLIQAGSRRSQAVVARNAALQAAAELQRKNEIIELSEKQLQAETYNAVFNEAKSLRAGHEPGWREKALGDLTRLASMPTPLRNLPEIRSEAAVALGTPDIQLIEKVALPTLGLCAFGFSPDSRTLLTADPATGLDFWDVANGRHALSAPGLKVVGVGTTANLVAYLATGNGLAVATRDSGVVFTDINGIRNTRKPITNGSNQPMKMAVSLNGQRIAIAWTGDGGTTVHDADNGEVLASFKDTKIAFSLSPDGRWLAREENGEIVLTPIDANESRIVLGTASSVFALAFSADGTTLAAASSDSTVSLWDIARRVQVNTLRGHRERVVDVAFSPDGQWVATGSMDYTARIWETRTGHPVATLVGPPSPAFAVKWSPGGDYLAVCMNNASEMYVYRITGRQPARQSLTGHTVGLGRVSAHPQRQQMTSSGYKELMSWDLTVAQPSAISIGPNPGPVTAMTYNADGSMLAVASGLKIVVRDPATGAILGQLTSPIAVWAVAFDPSGKHLACGDLSGKVTLYDLTSKLPIQQFATGFHINSVAIPDDSHLLTHGADAVMLFSIATGKLERKRSLAGGTIERFVVDSTHNHMVVGLESGAIASLSLPDLTPGTRIEKAHDGGANCLALSPDGRMLASAGRDRRVVLRDAMSLETLLDFPPAPWSVNDMTFDSQGRRLAIVGTGSDVDLWDLALLRQGLAGIGLTWDGAAPGIVPPASLRSPGEHALIDVPVLRRPDVVTPPQPKSQPVPPSTATQPTGK